MIRTVELKFKNVQRGIDYMTSPKLHGVLFKYMDKNYANFIHASNIKPFSQYVQEYENGIVWKINFLNDEAFENIGKNILDDNFFEFTLSHLKEKVIITEKKVTSEITYNDFFYNIMNSEYHRGLQAEFITPTAFKSNAQYTILPITKFIYQSTINKWNNFSPILKVNFSEMIDTLEKITTFRDYELSTKRFFIDGSEILGFCGCVNLFIKGQPNEVRFVEFLLRYAEVAGIGIKNSLGMGAVQISENDVKK